MAYLAQLWGCGGGEGIAEAIVYAVTQPERVSVNEILIRPTQQPV
jgi:NADP-dependent 3-hydroxy acid dehydrogenase YdfG